MKSYTEIYSKLTKDGMEAILVNDNMTPDEISDFLTLLFKSQTKTLSQYPDTIITIKMHVNEQR